MLMDPIHVHATVGLVEVVIFVQVIYTILAIVLSYILKYCILLNVLFRIKICVWHKLNNIVNEC